MIILENSMDIFDEQMMNANFAGTVAFSNVKKNPAAVLVAQNEGTNYVLASDLESYMEANDMINVAEAMNQIVAANQIALESTCVLIDEANEFTVDELGTAGIMTEASVDANSTSVRKVMKWYEKFVQKSKSKADTKTVVEARLNVLKSAKTKMEKALEDAKSGKKGDKIKYSLGSLIPFNGIYRCIAKDDVYAGIGSLARSLTSLVMNVVVQNAAFKMGTKEAEKVASGEKSFSQAASTTVKKSVAMGTAAGAVGNAPGVVIRYVSFEKMLTQQIKNTEEAIDFLEKELAKMK